MLPVMVTMLPNISIIAIGTVTYQIPHGVEQWSAHIPCQFNPKHIQNNTGATVAYLARQALRIIMNAGFCPYSSAELLEWLCINPYFSMGLEPDMSPVMVFSQLRLWATLLNDLIIIGEMFPNEFVKIV